MRAPSNRNRLSVPGTRTPSIPMTVGSAASETFGFSRSIRRTIFPAGPGAAEPVGPTLVAPPGLGDEGDDLCAAGAPAVPDRTTRIEITTTQVRRRASPH